MNVHGADLTGRGVMCVCHDMYAGVRGQHGRDHAGVPSAGCLLRAGECHLHLPARYAIHHDTLCDYVMYHNVHDIIQCVAST